MDLYTSLPARKDGTLNVTLNDGAVYVFRGVPLKCAVDDEDHADQLQTLGFMSLDEFQAEQKFRDLQAARENRQAAAAAARAPVVAGPDDGVDDDGIADSGDGLPVEQPTAPTGRVRRQSKAAAVVAS